MWLDIKKKTEEQERMGEELNIFTINKLGSYTYMQERICHEHRTEIAVILVLNIEYTVIEKRYFLRSRINETRNSFDATKLIIFKT